MEPSSSHDFQQLAAQPLPSPQQPQPQHDSLVVASRAAPSSRLILRLLIALAVFGVCCVPFVVTYEMNHHRAVTEPTVAYEHSRCQRCDQSGDCQFAFHGFRCPTASEPSGYRCCLADSNILSNFRCDASGDSCWKPQLSNAGRSFVDTVVGVLLAIVGLCVLCCYWCTVPSNVDSARLVVAA